ncbi:terminase family protein [Vibrio parahaemolyticus]|nr:terminase family protein [Vibrio parahaemolyticus]
MKYNKRQQEAAQKLNTAKSKVCSAIEKTVAWRPLDGSQSIFLGFGQGEYLVKEVLYTGGRGIGKSELLIADFLQDVGKGWGAAWNGVIFRREYKNLADLIAKSKKIISKAFPDAKFVGGNQLEWRFATGETLKFAAIKRDGDYDGWHGQEIAFIGFDELTTWSTGYLYESIRSCNRKTFQATELQPNPVPTRTRATTNPWGIGKAWVHDRFIKGRKPCEISYSKGIPALTYVFGSVFENIHMPVDYISELLEIKDPQKRAAWLDGDWDAVDHSQFFSTVFDKQACTIDPFRIPANWKVTRSFDWGQSTPFCGLWIAEADGNAVKMSNGKWFCPPEGTLIVIGECYGTPLDDKGNQIEANKGLYLSANQCGIMLREKEELIKELYVESEYVAPGAADNQIYNGKHVIDPTSKTVADSLAAHGMVFTMSNKAAGTRRQGAQIGFEMLEATNDAYYQECENDKPRLYFFNTCKLTIETLPKLNRCPLDPDAVAKGGDDHAWDTLRYRILQKDNEWYAA